MRTLATVMRVAALLAVVGAALLPALDLSDDQLSVVLVVDCSESVGPTTVAGIETTVRELHRDRAAAHLGVVTFDGRARLVVPVGAPLPAEPFLLPDEPVRGSDLEAALRLADGALPDTGRRRIVLLSDGRATRGDALGVMHELAVRGVAVDVVGVGSELPSAFALGAVRALEQRVAEGEPLEVVAEVRGPPEGSVQVRWSQDGTYLRTEWVTLDAQGRAETRLVDAAATTGLHTFEVQLDEGVAAASPQTGRAIAIVSGKPRVLLVTTAGERPGLLLSALEAAEASVQVLDLGEGTRLDEERLSGADLVVLHDLPLERDGEVTLLAGLSGADQRKLVEWVRERGGGLLVSGGAFGFSPEYADAPLARALPVEIEDLGELEDPPVAMAVMLDRSGSMGVTIGTHTKLQLAVEASLAAASTVRPEDRVAIASVDTVTVWHQPLAPAAELLARRERIRAMDLGGGGIFVYTALADAYAVLQRASEPIRHVILFSDTADSEEQWQGCPFAPCGSHLPYAVDLARTARMTGITTSVVGIGDPADSDVRFLQDLAASGGGRYYITTQGTDLRRIFVAETRATARSNILQGPIALVAADPHPALTGIDPGQAPPLGGLVQTRRRATADTALVGPDDRPVLASWRYGLGTVVAITTDVGGRWTEEWLAWEGAGQLLRQTTRFAMRQGAHGAADARVVMTERQMELVVDVPSDSEIVPSTVELFSVAGGAEPKRLQAELERVALGRYVARARLDGEPFVVARVRDDRGRLLAEAVGTQSAAREHDVVGPDGRALGELARAAAGRLDPHPAAILDLPSMSVPRPVPTWPFALALAALLVCLDLWLRRLVAPRRRALSPRGEAAAVPAGHASAPR